MVAIIIHGGAGTWPEDRLASALAQCERVSADAHRMLREGASALDAAEWALLRLEDNPLFNAGTGAHPNTEGEIEMDAILVDGVTGRFGAVAAIRNVRHPVSVARKVMEATPHCFLVGDGAKRFAHTNGFEFCPTGQLLTPLPALPAQDTVGAVALDAQGRIAAATSTGGTRNKMPGRVGDSPIFGCGAYANALAGVSATGIGEDLMRVMMARTVADAVAAGMDPMHAVAAGVAQLERISGQGGAICLDAQGRIGHGANTRHLAGAGIDGTGTRSPFL